MNSRKSVMQMSQNQAGPPEPVDVQRVKPTPAPAPLPSTAPTVIDTDVGTFGPTLTRSSTAPKWLEESGSDSLYG